LLGQVECRELGFYVYTLRDKNNIVRYVGKGFGDRYMQEHSSKKMGNIESQIKGLNHIIEAHKLPNEESAFVLESYLIDLYKDTLLNAVKGHYNFEWTPKTEKDLQEKYAPIIAYRRKNHNFNIIKVKDPSNIKKSLDCWVCKEEAKKWPWMLVEHGTGIIRVIYITEKYKLQKPRVTKIGTEIKMWVPYSGIIVDNTTNNLEYQQYIGEQIPENIRNIKRCTRFYWDDIWENRKNLKK
jgi:hypothetical protein